MPDKKDATKAPASGFRSAQLVTAAGISSLGDGLLVTALPLLAAALTKDPRLITGVYVAGRIPWAFSPFIGALIDRIGKPRRTMVVADLFRAVLLIVVAIALHQGAGLFLLYPTAFLLEAAQIGFATSSWSLVRHVTADDQLDRVNSRLAAAQTSGEQLVGPMIGSVAFTWGRSIPLVGDAVSFILSAMLLSGLREPPSNPLQRRVLHIVREGFEVVRKTPAVLVPTAWVACISLAHSMQVSGLVLLKEQFGLSERAFGGFIALIAAGNVLGALIAPRIIGLLRPHVALSLATLGSGLSHIVAGAMGTPLPVAAALAVDGVVVVVGSITGVGLRQRNTPKHLVGSVMATSRMAIYGAGIPGGILGGIITRETSATTTLIVAGVMMTLISLIGTRVLRRALRPGASVRHG
jgi:predicted MFS family arabinose efflux permease